MKSFILFINVIVFSFFLNTSDLKAIEMQDNSEIVASNESKEITINENHKNEKLNSSIEDIFGDEQTFPFVAGLGKNAAH